MSNYFSDYKLHSRKLHFSHAGAKTVLQQANSRGNFRLVAADIRLPIAATGALSAVLGLVLGYPNGLAMAESGQGLRGVLGSTAAIFIFFTLFADRAAATTIAWVRIAWRVLGSWIAASGLLLLGWALRGL